jgi:hypothetical protein
MRSPHIMLSGLLSATVLIHRILGITVGILMLVWFLSGLVMMYVGYPGLSEAERMRALAPISWQDCCSFGEGLLDESREVTRAQVETHLGRPTLRLRRPGRPDARIDLSRGTFVVIDPDIARRVASETAARIIGSQASPVAQETIMTDQWTIGRYGRDLPLHRIDFDDLERSSLYVSGTSGQLVLRTTATQRFWNWLGSVPHWIYFTVLRSDGLLWSQIVVWAAVLGSVLTVLGIGLGLTQLRRHRLSPYRGWLRWHHLAGLAFGLTTLSFVVSGLISMNPWGFLQSRGSGEGARLSGPPPNFALLRASLDLIRANGEPDIVSLLVAPFDGQLHWLASRADGTVTRLDARGRSESISPDDLERAAQRLAGRNRPVAEQGLIWSEDAYYFAPRDPFVLPVYRIILGDDEQTRYYVDPTTGALLLRADANGRLHRWLFGAMHRLDFAQSMRQRPFWDLAMWALLLGGAVLSATGCWLAIRSVRQDVMRLARAIRGPHPRVP